MSKMGLECIAEGCERWNNGRAPFCSDHDGSRERRITLLEKQALTAAEANTILDALEINTGEMEEIEEHSPVFFAAITKLDLISRGRVE